jgi:hypothetical protein
MSRRRRGLRLEGEGRAMGIWDWAGWNAVAAIGQWAGALVTLGGFYFVTQQLRRERSALETQTSAQVYQGSIGILNLFIDRPELRPYFYDDVPLPEQEPERSRVLAACEVMADHWENTCLSGQSLHADTLRVWSAYMVRVYRRSPALRAFLLREGHCYSNEFLALLDPELPAASRRAVAKE